MLQICDAFFGIIHLQEGVDHLFLSRQLDHAYAVPTSIDHQVATAVLPDTGLPAVGHFCQAVLEPLEAFTSLRQPLARLFPLAHQAADLGVSVFLCHSSKYTPGPSAPARDGS